MKAVTVEAMVNEDVSAGNATSQHEDPEHLAINNTLLNRVLTRLALKTTGRLFSADGLCKPVLKRIIVKTGRRVHLTEAATMKFIAEHTSIPVPKVHCAFIYKDRAYIVMGRISGDDLPTAWQTLSASARTRVREQLREMLNEMRSLQPPIDCGVESCVGGSLYDSRISHSRGRFGPFKTIQDFHLWAREGIRPSELRDWKCEESDWHDIKRMAELQDGPWPPPVFTHADLNPFNILIRDEKVVGIIDWEFAGWYPTYWEYASAWCGNVTRTEWQSDLDRILEPFGEELEMEKIRQKWWGEI